MDTAALMTFDTTCCIAGGGPAGMMLGFLLARAGIDVIVLEKHKDFFRDFRGDTIHPSTFQLIYELGLLEEFLKVPHQELTELRAQFNGVEITIADLSHLDVVKKAVGLMPQWDFLDFLKMQASKYPAFHLMMSTEAKEVLRKGDTVTGLRAQTKEGPVSINATLVVGTDGRHSTIREQAKLKVIKSGAPIDVLWFRISKAGHDPGQVLGRFYMGTILVSLDRGDYWQCAYVIEKGAYASVQQRGIDAFRQSLVEIVPFFKDRVNEVKSWDDIKLLSVDIDHLEKWYCEGLLCIGDAAHAMSPIGGVGINLAIQDAVATANILYPFLAQNMAPLSALKRIQKRRTFAVKIIQGMQTTIQNGIVHRRRNRENTKLPLPFRLLKMFPFLGRLTARLIGMGPRPEHIKTPDVPGMNVE